MAGVRKNMVATAYGMAVITIGQIALVPIFLHAWGASVYGQWLVLSAVPAYLSLSDVGIGHALGNLLSINVERGKTVEAQRMLSAALRFQGIFALSLFALALFMLVALPLGDWLKIESLGRFEVGAILLSLVAYSLLPIQIGCFSGVYRAASQYPRFLFIQGHARLLEVISTAVVLVCGASMVVLASVLVAVRMIWLLAVLVDSRGRVPGLEAKWAEGSWADFRSLLPLGFGYFAFPIGNALVNQGVLLVVNHLGGPLSVVMLNVCRQTCRIYLQMTSALSASLHPELTVAFARSDRERLLKLAAGGVGVVVISGAVFVLFVTAAGPQIVLWWTGKLSVSSLVIGLLALESVTAGISNVFLLPLWAANRLGSLPFWYLASQAVGLIGVWFLFDRFTVSSVGIMFALVNAAFGVLAWREVLAMTACRAADFPSFVGSGIRHFARSMASRSS